MQLFGTVGLNTFYFSSAKFESGLVVKVDLYGPDRLFLIEIELDEHLPGIYVFEYTFFVLGKYLAVCKQNGNRVLLGTILIGPVVASLTPRIVIPSR